MIMVGEALPSCLPWRHVTDFFIQKFEQLALALKNRVCPELYHCVEIFFTIHRIFEQLALALKTEFALKIFTVLNILFTFRIFEQLLLALKNKECPEFVLNSLYSFYHSEFWTTCACPEKQSLPWIHCIKYIFFCHSEFWTTCACPEK